MVRGKGHLSLVSSGRHSLVDESGAISHIHGPMGNRRVSAHIPEFLAARSYRPNSERQRSVVLAQFARAVGDPRARDLTARMVIAWWDDISHLKPASRRAYLSAVRVFCGHLVAMGALESDPTTPIQQPKVYPREPVTLEPHEVIRVLTELDNTRDRAVAALMLGCGLRSHDVAMLQVEDVDLHARVLVVEGKGGKRRAVPMPKATVECVSDYLHKFPAESGPLIRHRWKDQGVTAHAVRLAMVRVLERAGVKRAPWDGRSAHVFRRTCATNLLESGASVRDVQQILGHESIATTEAYLRRPGMDRLQRLIELGPLEGA